jgi:hypothetical protein
MISIESSGRLGNKINYFILGMYIHETKGMNFKPEYINGFVNTYDEKCGCVVSNQTKVSSIYNDRKNLLKNISNLSTGFLVDNMIDKYFILKEMDVKRYLNMDNIVINNNKPKNDELVIYIRLGDYVDIGCVIDKKLYMDIIDNEKNNINSVTIVTDSPNHEYINDFRIIGCDIRSTSPLDDFAYIKNAKKICISNSSFSWTAAYISEADFIYWPISSDKWPLYANPSGDDADLRPLDKINWIYL